jgi:Ca2+-binding EF-hand superfamily protein
MMKHVVDSDRAEEDDESNTKLHSTDVEFAMKEFDADGDGAVSVEEYIAMVFHESPQVSPPSS